MRNIFYLFLLICNFSFGQSYYNSAEEKVFQLIPGDYGIVQGTVDQATALNNRYAIEQAMADAKAQKYTTFRASNLDAFFEVTTVTSTTNLNFYPWVESINTVEGMTFDFRDNVTFRVFPNDRGEFNLLTVFEDNVTVKGGKFIGDRYEHIGGDQRGYGVRITASKNVLVDGVTSIENFGDGIAISSRNFTYQSNYDPANNVIVRNSTFEDNRRQGMSIADGFELFVENNRFIYNGNDINGSLATNPRCGIDVEAQRRRNTETGELILDQYVYNLTIRGNYEEGSGNTGILMHIGDSVTIENNTTQRGIVYDIGKGGIIRNNTIIGTRGNGISMNRANPDTHDNLVYGNYISGTDVGINVAGDGATIRDNEAYQFKDSGLKISGATNAIIEDNIFDSDVTGSYGLYANATTTGEVTIRNNSFKSQRAPLKISSLSLADSLDTVTPKSLILRDNQFLSGTAFEVVNSEWLDILGGNTFNIRGFVSGSNNITFQSTSIQSTGTYALDLRSGNNFVNVIGNTFNATSSPVKWDVIPGNFIYNSNILNGVSQEGAQ